VIFGMEQDRMRDWKIARVSTRTAQRFSIRHVLYPASGKRRHAHEMEFGFVLRMINKLHWLWFTRVKQLVINQMWLPGNVDATRQSRLFTIRRVMNCRPTSVFFKQGNFKKIRPCKQHKVCPFCWGRLASFIYRRIKGRICRARKTRDDLVLYCRVISHFVPAKGFHSANGLSAEEIQAHACALRSVLIRHRSEYKRLVKQLQRKTVGSCWRVVVDPQENGWNVEARQLLLMRPTRAKMQWVKWRGSKTVFSQSTKIDNNDAVYPLIGKFMEYPAGLLTSYMELTCVYLQAGYGLRLASGTGLFRTCGDGLLRAFKKDKKNGEASSTLSTEEGRSDECDPTADEVFV
jgi:hypothetical protein